MNKIKIIALATMTAALAACSGNDKESTTNNEDMTNDAVSQQEEQTLSQTAEEVAEVVSEQVTEAVEKVSSNEAIPSWMPKNVTITPSGLGIVIEKPGDATRAGENTPVTVHYRGTLTDGTVFDSSYDRGQPATFQPNQVVPGFGEGIRMLGKGGKATLYLPSDLAYGPRAIPQAGIAANSNLIFDIEIVDIAK
ncbi:MAG: FKBP-type peptidyl-prolyl cis-trans isomerase [Muribaculaceae bacterium]|nr:FKBP-type peptidyl-prolyl cis-trans isomerase [Muribaculaceae bacterium]